MNEVLGAFQHTLPNKEDVRKLIHTINSAIERQGEKSLATEFLNKLFDRLWPDIESSLKTIIGTSASTTPSRRPDREILAEILDVVRSQQRRAEAASDTTSHLRMNEIIRVSKGLINANDNVRRLDREIVLSNEENIDSLQNELDQAVELKGALELELKNLETRCPRRTRDSDTVTVTPRAKPTE